MREVEKLGSLGGDVQKRAGASERKQGGEPAGRDFPETKISVCSERMTGKQVSELEPKALGPSVFPVVHESVTKGRPRFDVNLDSMGSRR